MAIRVLIIEKSQLSQKALASFALVDGDIKIVSIVSNLQQALSQIKTHRPQVLILDMDLLDAPGKDEFEKLIKIDRIPVIWTSSSELSDLQRSAGYENELVSFLAKPAISDDEAIENFGTLLREQIIALVSDGVRIKKSEHVPLSKSVTKPISHGTKFRDIIIAIGASTGGAEALKEILMHLPANCPPIVVTQHMPSRFTSLFSKRLNDLCAVNVVESSGNEILTTGNVYIAPGGLHLSIRRGSKGLETHLDKTEPVNLHRPSVDVLFYSVAQQVGSHAIGILLTGMGRDGAEGLGAMYKAGAYTIAQDEGSSVVFGMPRAAIEAGYVKCIAQVEKIAAEIIRVATE